MEKNLSGGNIESLERTGVDFKVYLVQSPYFTDKR